MIMPFISPVQAGGANVCAFLDLIAFAEGTSRASGSASGLASRDDGYDVVVAGEGGPEIFTSYASHPFSPSRAAKLIRSHPPLYSTAAGRYQLLCRYWEIYRGTLRLPDFGPLSQDLIAIQQMRERGALAHLLSGDISAAIKTHLRPVELEEAIEDCDSTWASFPGNTYGQGGRSMDALLRRWELSQGAEPRVEPTASGEVQSS
jgi:muramidase (phage lysozyme)